MRHSRPVAALSMYDQPILRGWNAGVIKGLRDDLDLPTLVDRSDWSVHAVWRHPQLLMAQTCIEPLRHGGARGLTVIGFPVQDDIDGCEGPTYRSVILRRAGDLPTVQRFAVNGRESMSGWVALLKSREALNFDDPQRSDVIISGSHAASIQLLKRGQADIAAIDCVTLHWLLAEQPDLLDGLERLGMSPKAPSLPLVTRAGKPLRPMADIRAAVQRHFGPIAVQEPDC